MPRQNPLGKKWSKDEMIVLLAAAPPVVREFLRGLHVHEVASPEELGLPPTVVKQATQLFHARHKLPLFDVYQAPIEREDDAAGTAPKNRFVIRPEFRASLAEVLRAAPAPAVTPFRARAREAARHRTGPPLSTFSFQLERPNEAAGLIGLVNFLNEDVPLGLSFVVNGDGRNFTVEVR